MRGPPSGRAQGGRRQPRDEVSGSHRERFTEWKAALINHAAGKVPNLFRLLEADVRDGRLQPHPEEGALKYRSCTPGYDITELAHVRYATTILDMDRVPDYGTKFPAPLAGQKRVPDSPSFCVFEPVLSSPAHGLIFLAMA
jgi:hypothetical protein